MKFFFRYFVLAIVVSALLPQQTQAQVANNNPTGPAGDYNGIVTTAGSYDPFTGNASRVIDDIVVAGAVGAYPLKWTRRMNTRAWTRPDTFGRGGGWSHNYQWELAINHPGPWEPPPGGTDERADGVLDYPDGRSVNLDTPWENVQPIPAAQSPFGTMDRFIFRQGGDYDLLMADGGVVKFYKLVQDPSHPHCEARAIEDPYKLATVLHYDDHGRLDKVTEPGQSNPRYLQIHYSTEHGLIARVEANDGFNHVTQWVDYVYEPLTFDGQTFLYLRYANYNGGDMAEYKYQQSNRLPLNNHDFEGNYAGVIWKCSDDRFAGPMKRIEYELRPRNSPFDTAYGEIWKEKNAFGDPLSRVEVLPGLPTSRQEHRGNDVRTFQYTIHLSARSDFLNPPNWARIPNTSTFQDERLNTTTTTREGEFQVTTRVTYPPIPPATEGSYVETLYEPDPERPLYVQFHRDERGKTTEYVRDHTNHMVLRINHPSGGGFETFTYNEFGQVKDHQMTNGGIEHFTYDSRGLKRTYTPPDSDPPEGFSPTRYFYYGDTGGLVANEPDDAGEELDQVGEERPDLNDRLRRVIDPRGYSTYFLYNRRGQVTKVIRTGGATTKSEYNSDGTLLWTQDELGHTTNYICDEYKRVTEVKKLVDGVEEKVTNDYTPRNGLDSFSHTTASVYSVESLHTRIDHDYDANFRRIWTTAAPGALPTNFHYDPVGNLDWVEDPRHKFTHFGHDERNRQTSTLNDELSQSVEVEYDPAGNKMKETRHEENGVPVFRSWDYDNMNRLWHAYDWRTNPTPAPHQTTTYQPDDAGNVLSITDTKGAVYEFEYDKLNRKTKAKYPTASGSPTPTETWHYDAAGNVDIYNNPANQVRNFHYDNRNRQDHSWWNGGAAMGPDIVTYYDNASRVTSITTKNGESPITKVAFGYDEANRKIWEDQTLFRPNGTFMSHRVKSALDHDGRRTNLQITDPPQAGGNLTLSSEMSGSRSYSISYNYNDRNQLWHINGEYGENWHFTYLYDHSGNMTSRQADYNGNTSSTNCPNDDYDALNRPRTWEQTGPNAFYTLSHHQYDKANREVATWRDEDQGRGDRFAYEATNQLAGVAYNAPDVSAWPPAGAERTVTYDHTPDKLNRSIVTEAIAGQAATTTSYAHDPLNQYTAVGGANYSYDDNFNLTHAGAFLGVYDAANHLVSASNTGTLAASPMTAGFVYDGLGRCVKRTLGDEATVFVYDGWKPIGEFDAWGNFQAWNVYGPGADEILLRQKDGMGYTIFLLDRHGNVAFLVNNDGNVLENYTYDVFGQPTITKTESGEKLSATSYSHDFLFQGREYIWQLGIYDYRNRFYLPATGRFLQTDPTGFGAGDMNLFRYCGDDPVDGNDPMGLFAGIVTDGPLGENWIQPDGLTNDAHNQRKESNDGGTNVQFARATNPSYSQPDVYRNNKNGTTTRAGSKTVTDLSVYPISNREAIVLLDIREYYATSAGKEFTKWSKDHEHKDNIVPLLALYRSPDFQNLARGVPPQATMQGFSRAVDNAIRPTFDLKRANLQIRADVYGLHIPRYPDGSMIPYNE